MRNSCHQQILCNVSTRRHDSACMGLKHIREHHTFVCNTECKSQRRLDETPPWALNDVSGEAGDDEKGRRRGGARRSQQAVPKIALVQPNKKNSLSLWQRSGLSCGEGFFFEGHKYCPAAVN